jgi:NAD(P)-dependent dehydrogenase (short-subunit alcohol dehydrogenase family)
VTVAAVLGAGSWGTAYAAVLAHAGTRTTLWARRAELAEAICRDHENADYLPGIALPDELQATHDPQEALAGADLVVLAIPSQTLRDNLSSWAAYLPSGALLVSLMKGVELGTTKRMSEVICEVADVSAERVAVVSGPNLAKEVAQHQPAAAGRRLLQRRRRGPAAGRLPHHLLPPLHQHRRRRLRARRRGQERHRARGRDGRGHGVRRQHPRHDHHPRAR